MDSDRRTRRSLLASVSLVAPVGIAGCGGGGDGGDGDGGVATVSGDEYPTVDEWLTESEVGPATDNYGGSLVDRRDADTVRIDVGASGNDGNFAFGPPGVVVSAGTEVRWNWTGEGNPHNVEAEPDEQIGRSDYEFSSGDAVGGSGVQFTRTMDTAGIALYHCEPHLSLGMKGGVAVE